MPDSAPVAAASHRLEPAHTALARRTLLAAAIFTVAAAIAFAFDVLQTPERRAAASIVFAIQLALCALTSILAAVAGRWVRGVVALTGPLLPISIGIYHGLVGAPLESSTLTLALYLAGAALLMAGPLVQSIMLLGVAAGFACALSAVRAATVAPVYCAAVLGGVGVLSIVAAAWHQRRHCGARAHLEARARMQAEHARATALLDTSRVLAAVVHDFDALASAAAEQARVLLDADWSVFWHRDPHHAFRVAAVSGLPPVIAGTVRESALAPDAVAAVYERIVQQPALALSQRDARRLLPLDTVAPVLRHALAGAVRLHDQVAGIVFVAYATRRMAATAEPESLLAGLAEQVAIALGNARLIDTAQNANRAKSEFIATMSHELRTPINVVMGYADLLIEGAFGTVAQDQLDVLNRVRHQSAQLLDLVQPMLDLNRLEARQSAVARDPFTLGELVESLQLTVPASWCKPGVALLWEVPLDPDVVLHNDRAKIEVIVRNLIHNALKYTDHGEVAVRFESATIPDHVEITVRDTGMGIAPNDLPVVFEMFGQANSDLPRDGGVGLGLYIVKRLTDVLGGQVTVSSERGAGSTFTVTLPVDAPAPP